MMVSYLSITYIDKIKNMELPLIQKYYNYVNVDSVMWKDMYFSICMYENYTNIESLFVFEKRDSLFFWSNKTSN